MKNYLVINGTAEPLTPAQIELINFIADPYAAKDRVSEFENIFELALFSSEIPIDKKEKNALHSLSMLTEYLQNVSSEDH
jgi:hypothetical protein